MKAANAKLAVVLMLSVAAASAAADTTTTATTTTTTTATATRKKSHKPAAKVAAPAKLDAAKATVDDIRACMKKNWVAKGSLRDIVVTATDRDGQAHNLKMRLFWKPDKATGSARMNLRVVEPKELADSSYLLLDKPAGEEVYFYLPAAGNVQRITGSNMSQPLWGTDFSYSEIKQVQGLLENGATERKADDNVGGRPAYVLETATNADTGYFKVVSHVDQQGCVLVKSEFFVKPGDAERKVLEADTSTLINADTYWYALAYTMTDKKLGTKTRLDMSNLNLFEGSREKLFDPAAFYQDAE